MLFISILHSRSCEIRSLSYFSSTRIGTYNINLKGIERKFFTCIFHWQTLLNHIKFPSHGPIFSNKNLIKTLKHVLQVYRMNARKYLSRKKKGKTCKLCPLKSIIIVQRRRALERKVLNSSIVCSRSSSMLFSWSLYNTFCISRALVPGSSMLTSCRRNIFSKFCYYIIHIYNFPWQDFLYIFSSVVI